MTLKKGPLPLYSRIFPDARPSAAPWMRPPTGPAMPWPLPFWKWKKREIPFPLPSNERLLQRRCRNEKVCVILVDMDSYRAFCAYKVKHADAKSAEWAASARKGRKVGILARVFGLR